MYTTLLRLAWPYLMRFATTQAAKYLEQRREQRVQAEEQPNNLPEYPPGPPSAETDTEDEQEGSFFWYALSGLLLGGAFSMILYILLQEDETQQ